MSYPISRARKIIYDAVVSDITGIDIYDAIAPDDAQPPFIVMDGFSLIRSTKCGYDVTCRISVYDMYNARGGNLRADETGGKLLTICEAIGFDITASTQGVRTFNRANYRQQFEVTLKDL